MYLFIYQTNFLLLFIDLNTKDHHGMTGFILACYWGRKYIVEMLIENSHYFKIDLTAKDNSGCSGYFWAKLKRKEDVIDIIERKMPTIAY